MPDATLFAQYRAIMQNTALLGLYRELLAQLPPVDAELLPEDRVPVPAEWAPFVAARWALVHTELWQPEALAEQAANRIRSLDLCL